MARSVPTRVLLTGALLSIFCHCRLTSQKAASTLGDALVSGTKRVSLTSENSGELIQILSTRNLWQDYIENKSESEGKRLVNQILCFKDGTDYSCVLHGNISYSWKSGEAAIEPLLKRIKSSLSEENGTNFKLTNLECYKLPDHDSSAACSFMKDNIATGETERIYESETELALGLYQFLVATRLPSRTSKTGDKVTGIHFILDELECSQEKGQFDCHIGFVDEILPHDNSRDAQKIFVMFQKTDSDDHIDISNLNCQRIEPMGFVRCDYDL